MLQCANECKFLLMMSEITGVNDGGLARRIRRFRGFFVYVAVQFEGRMRYTVALRRE
jgi:hypothetical protein